VIRVKDEEHVERLLEHGIGSVARLRDLEEHAQEVSGVGELVVRVDIGHPEAVPVRKGRQGRHLSEQAVRLELSVLGIEDVLGVRVERREPSDGGHQHAHRVRVI
jgi:hypothetical protein